GRPFEEGAGEPDPIVVLRGGAAGDAGAEAFLDLVADARRRARAEGDELGLVAVEHRDVVGAVAQAEGGRELARGGGHGRGADEGAVVEALSPGPAPRDGELRRAAARDPEEGVVPEVALVRDVEAGAQALDQPELLEQRRELVGRVLPLDL